LLVARKDVHDGYSAIKADLIYISRFSPCQLKGIRLTKIVFLI
jgi:hypothetical protein